jgi:hypothetical protein
LDDDPCPNGDAQATGASHLLPEPLQRPLISLFFNVKSKNNGARILALNEKGEFP